MGVTNYYSLEGEIIGERTGAIRTDYSRDALGSVTATRTSAPVRDTYGATYRYKPYVARLAKTGTAPDPNFQSVRTAGYKETSISHSKSYVRARHYGQEEGRWTIVDPIWPSQDMHAYANYCPTVGNDPSGLYCSDGKCLQLVYAKEEGRACDVKKHPTASNEATCMDIQIYALKVRTVLPSKGLR